MKIEMSKSRKLLFYVTMMLTNIAVMGELVMAPIIYQFYEVFYYDIPGVNFIVSGPTLIMVIASLLTPMLCAKTSKKNVLLLGGILFTVGAVFGAAVESIPFIIAMRILVGAGEGIVNVAAMALIAEVFVDEEKRGMFMGVYSSGMCIFGAIMSTLSGILSESGWQASFKVYWSAVVMVIFMVMFLPSIAPEKEEKTTVSKQKKEPCGTKFWIMLAIYAVANLSYAMITYYTSSYIAENEIGGPTFAGLASSVTSIAGFFTGLAFGKLYQKFGDRTGALSYLISTVGIIVLVLFQNVFSAFAGCFLAGAGYGLLNPYAYAAASFLVPPSRIDDSMSYVTIAYSLPMFLSTYFVTFLMDVMKTQLITPTWVVAAVIYGLCILAALVTTKKHTD